MILSDILRETAADSIRRCAHSTVREVRNYMGPASHDGPGDGSEQVLLFCHIHREGIGKKGSERGCVNYDCKIDLIFKIIKSSSGLFDKFV